MKEKIKLGIKSKMLIFIISTSLLIYIAAIGYISINSRQMAFEDATKFADSYTREYASKIEAILNSDMAKVRTLAHSVLKYRKIPLEERKSLHSDMYDGVINNNPHFLALWDSWELSNIDSTWNKSYGRYVIEFWREENKINNRISLKSLDGDNPDYARIKRDAIEVVEEPYLYSYTEKPEDEILMTSLIAPIIDNGKYAGVIGVDITLSEFQELINEIKPFKGSSAYLLSNTGAYVGHPDEEMLGKFISETYPEDDNKYNITENIQNGEFFSFTIKNKNTGKSIYYSFAPLFIGETITPWSLAINVPVDVIIAKANRSFYISILVGIIGLILLTIVIWFIAKNISNPLIKTINLLKNLAKGKIDDKNRLNIKSKDEIGEMAESVNKLIDGLNSTANFARQIGEGNLDAEFNLLSDEDILGNSLLEMRKNLKHAEGEENKRKTENEKQNWITQGITKFGEILRQNYDNLEILSFNIISNIVNYLDVNQGNIFVINDSDKNDIYFELTAAVAFDRNKYSKKKINIGEDLVGRCAHEKLTIYLTDVPDGYIDITSGMGAADPKYILLVPLKLNEEVFGVIELASFKEFETYKIEFIEKVGESIASTISSVKINEKTAELLGQAQKQSEELSSQEEEMRQNLEELQTTQEEASRREFEMQGLILALSSSTYTAEYDVNGKIIDINEQYADLIGIPKDQIIGMYHKDGIDFSGTSIQEYETFWNDLISGISKKEITKIDYNNREMWLSETYTPIHDKDEAVYKILKIAIDITELKNTSIRLEVQAKEIEESKQQLNQKIEELNKTEEKLLNKDIQQREEIDKLDKENKIKLNKLNTVINTLNESLGTLELSLSGTILTANEKYLSLAGLKIEEISGKKLSDFVSKEIAKSEKYQKIWEDLRKGINHEGEHKYIFKEKEIWLFETFTAVKDENKKIIKVFVTANDISEIKKNEAELIAKQEEYKSEIEKINKKYSEQIDELEKQFKGQENKQVVDKPKQSKPPKPTGNNLIDWTPSLVIGINELDEQHKKLVELANQLYKAFKSDKSKKEIKDSIKNFVDYTSYHFITEERYFKEFNYQETDEHIKEHQSFIKEINNFQKDYNQGKIKFLDEIMNYLNDWLTNHFMNTDSKYITLFKEKGL
ncbi:MAG: bacteriohemerythrin [Bacteroidales bacterium]|nr:bacteriohemerythrin [Bacteroidales bacterium]